MQHTIKPPTFWAQLRVLFQIELTNWRWAWQGLLITGLVTPLLSMVAFGVFARDSGRTTLEYILTGNIVLSLLFGNLNNVQGHMIYLRIMGTLDYFATLPIRRYVLIVAMVLSFLVISLPALILTIFLGSYLLGVPISIHPLIVVVIPLCAISLSGIGALIAVNSRTPESAASVSLLVTALLISLGPVVVPPDRLARPLLLLGWLSPTTYAASALRQTLLGPLTAQFGLDLLVLAGFGIVTLGLVGAKMDWRQH